MIKFCFIFLFTLTLPLSSKEPNDFHRKYVTASEEMAKQNQILEFWFGNEQTEYPLEKSKLWFSKQRAARDAEFDKLILDSFQKDLVSAAQGFYNSWESTPQGRLALILLMDQFPRNMFRGTPGAFAFDHLSLAIAKRGIAAGDDQQLGYAERLFFYLPFSHSESLEDQNQGVTLQDQLKNDVPESLKTIFERHYYMAELHRKTVEKFGRLSSRNAILGRESTPEEKEFLKDPEHHF